MGSLIGADFHEIGAATRVIRVLEIKRKNGLTAVSHGVGDNETLPACPLTFLVAEYLWERPRNVYEICHFVATLPAKLRDFFLDGLLQLASTLVLLTKLRKSTSSSNSYDYYKSFKTGHGYCFEFLCSN